MAKNSLEKQEVAEPIKNLETLAAHLAKYPEKNYYKLVMINHFFTPHDRKTESEWKVAINKILTEDYK